ncbi:hypothetical protein [Janibacter sp. GS2]|uniref:hypothetical protein n=1 Tax=Janibacter sp. GS2 TaxID=3442646 RepID=UPI003EC0F007
MTTAAHARIAALGHALVALLLVFDKAGYGGRPRGLLGELADHPAWAILHVAAAASLLAAASPRHRAGAACASASVMGVWSVLLLWWATSLEPDATWLAGTLGILAAAHAIRLADLNAQEG